MPDWNPIARVEDCPPGSALEAVVGEQIVALFNVDGEFYALDGVCSHQGGPLGKGALDHCVVTCPWHGWQYDVRSGANQVNTSVTQPAMPVKIVDGQVYVKMDS